MTQPSGSDRVLALAVLALTLPYDGWVLTKLWAWFLVPLGAPNLPGVWFAAGLTALASYLTNQRPPNEHEPSNGLSFTLAFCVIRPTFALAFGALFHALAT